MRKTLSEIEKRTPNSLIYPNAMLKNNLFNISEAPSKTIS